ncbi:hypothetical protein Btru_004216 [Bulinus truncatus]|nr:hypothetical protein Btru_004216 [Bulinus truncatus]
MFYGTVFEREINSIIFFANSKYTIMSAKTRKTDPLSRYFKDLDENELSDSDDDGVKNEASDIVSENKQSTVKYIKGEKTSSNLQLNTTTTGGLTTTSATQAKLPSANECLNSQNKPAFLQVLDKKDLDWNTLEKRLVEDSSNEVVDYKSNAVPPPSSYEPVTDPGIKVVDKEGRKRKPTDDDVSTKAYKVHKDEESD